jgi:hypothetical protein
LAALIVAVVITEAPRATTIITAKSHGAVRHTDVAGVLPAGDASAGET